MTSCRSKSWKMGCISMDSWHHLKCSPCIGVCRNALRSWNRVCGTWVQCRLEIGESHSLTVFKLQALWS